MNLGQTLLVVAALGLLGILVLNSNRTVLETNETQNMSEFGITAVSLATSLVEEAQGKMFDEVISDSTTATLTDPNQLTPADAANLGPEGSEAYRAGILDFDDFDDFDGLVLAFKSPLDSASIPGATMQLTVPGIRAIYIVETTVRYVADTDLDTPVTYRTWHKRLMVKVKSPSMKDSLMYPSIMSYWN
jgi:hypothetical protein